MNTNPQAKRVLRHMMRFGSITNAEAHAILKVRSVSRRICDIEQDLTVMVKRERHLDAEGQRYVRYVLTSGEKNFVRSQIRLGAIPAEVDPDHQPKPSCGGDDEE